MDIIYIIVQIFNLIVFFWIFYYFFWWKIVRAVEDRNNLMDKLKHAEEEYDRIIDNAETEKKSIIEDWIKHKNKLIEEWKVSAENHKEIILSEARKKSDDILEQAKVDSQRLKKDLEDNWEYSVRLTAKNVCKKIFDDNLDLQEAYLDNALRTMNR